MHSLFPYAHATHPQWRMAASLVLAQLRAQMALPEYAAAPNLGLVYCTDHYAAEAQALLSFLRSELPAVSDWTGTVGVGIAANNVEYFDEPALCVMLLAVPREHYRVFSGISPLNPKAFPAHSALVHADGSTPDLADLLAELSVRTSSGYLFGGLAASRSTAPQIAALPATAAAEGVHSGGLSGVAFSQEVSMHSRLTQGCEPIALPNGAKAKPLRITKSEAHVVLELDGEPALDVLLAALGVSLAQPQQAVQHLRQTLVGLTADSHSTSNLAQSQGRFGEDTRVRHLVGLDPLRRGIAVADFAPQGSWLTFCERNRDAARRDLMRIGAEIREELEPAEDALLAASPAGAEQASSSTASTTKNIAHSAMNTLAVGQNSSKKILGAIYVSCAGRGGPHFGSPSAELQILRHALGDVPLVGFFAGGEIAHRHIYGYTGVLTVFTASG